ncbi:hypothetical protein AAH092_05025, partial [Bacteroides xylanisolvens]|uniref:hypothetical protein n=1 Tax=Bacteroides xylanisolvens TaxID=371601 RepID=UPI0039B57C8E
EKINEDAGLLYTEEDIPAPVNYYGYIKAPYPDFLMIQSLRRHDFFAYISTKIENNIHCANRFRTSHLTLLPITRFI